MSSGAHTPTGYRVGFVSTRFAGTDGVSLETAKWAMVLERLGHACFFFAGECDTPAERTRTVPEAFFGHPDIDEIQNIAYNQAIRPPHISVRIAEFADQKGVQVVPLAWHTGITAAAALHFQAATINTRPHCTRPRNGTRSNVLGFFGSNARPHSGQRCSRSFFSSYWHVRQRMACARHHPPIDTRTASTKQMPMSSTRPNTAPKTSGHVPGAQGLRLWLGS